MLQKRVNIFCGNFGSGKTEISLNLSIKMAEENNEVTLVDLDIVNPYFRSREKKDLLQKYDIDIISSTIKHQHADLPALSPSVISPLIKQKGYVFFDVGGDDIGANVLGRYSHMIKKTDHSFYFVVNCRRPLTGNKEGIIDLIKTVETKSKLKVTGLINNTNLGNETKIQDVLEGYDIIEDVSKTTNIPLAFHTVNKDIEGIEKLYNILKEPIVSLKLYMHHPWED